MIEKWKPVVGFPLYEVSTLGRVKSLSRSYIRPNPRNGAPQLIVLKERIVKGWLHQHRQTSDYKSVHVALRRDKKTYDRKVAHLVLVAFVGPRPIGQEACHINGNPKTNRVDNLRWGTHKSNAEDMRRHGRAVNPPIHFGEKHHNAKLSDVEIVAIRSAKLRHGTMAELARRYKTTQTTIGRIVHGFTRTTQAR